MTDEKLSPKEWLREHDADGNATIRHTHDAASGLDLDELPEALVSLRAERDELLAEQQRLLKIERVAGAFINNVAMYCSDKYTRDEALKRYRELWGAEPRPGISPKTGELVPPVA